MSAVMHNTSREQIAQCSTEATVESQQYVMLPTMCIRNEPGYHAVNNVQLPCDPGKALKYGFASPWHLALSTTRHIIGSYPCLLPSLYVFDKHEFR